MTKADFINRMHARNALEISKSQAVRALTAVIAALEEALADGQDVTLTGFGSFRVASRPARTGRNPRTGKSIAIPARKTVKFTPGKNLKEAVK